MQKAGEGERVGGDYAAEQESPGGEGLGGCGDGDGDEMDGGGGDETGGGGGDETDGGGDTAGVCVGVYVG